MKAVVVFAALLLSACGGRGSAGEPSHAADRLIERAGSAKEREELTRVRDDVDAAARARLRELDAEIARLEAENAALRK